MSLVAGPDREARIVNEIDRVNWVTGLLHAIV